MHFGVAVLSFGVGRMAKIIGARDSLPNLVSMYTTPMCTRCEVVVMSEYGGQKVLTSKSPALKL